MNEGVQSNGGTTLTEKKYSKKILFQ